MEEARACWAVVIKEKWSCGYSFFLRFASVVLCRPLPLRLSPFPLLLFSSFSPLPLTLPQGLVPRTTFRRLFHLGTTTTMSDEKHSADLKVEDSDRDVEKTASPTMPTEKEKVPLDAKYDPEFVRRTL